MLKIYDQNKNFAGYITEYLDMCIVKELETGDETMSFTLGSYDASVLQNEYYIETEDQVYVVKSVDISSKGYPEYECQLDLEELESYEHESFAALNVSLQDAANLAVAGTGWTISTDVDKIRSVGTLKATPYDVLDKIKDAWMCEMSFDTKNKVVTFKEEFGEDRGVYFTRQLNLKTIKCTSDSYDFYTRLIPIGADDLRITDINAGKDYVENYQYSNKIRTLIWEDSSYESAEVLKEDAIAKLEDMSKPQKSYDADVADLAKMSQKYSVLEYGLGDTITLIDEQTGIKEKQRIVKIKEYPQNPAKNSCELSNTTLSFEDMQKKLEAAASSLDEITNADGTVKGVYVHGVEADGIVGIETVINNSSAVTTIKGNVEKIDGEVLGIEKNVTELSGDIEAAVVRIGTLETTSLTVTEADAKYATIENLDATNATVSTIQGDYADFKTTTTDELAANKALIGTVEGDLASFEKTTTDELVTAKGWMLEGAIGDAQISSVSANKLTAGTIDAANITVKNLNADNITTGTINGQLIGTGSVALDKLSEDVATQDSLDATNETLSEVKSTADSNSAKITSFNNTVNTLSQTVNTVKQTADTNTTNIKSLTSTVDEVSGDVTALETKESELEQSLNGFKTTVSNTYLTKSDASSTYTTQTTFNQTATEIRSNVSTLEDGLETANSNITQNSNKIGWMVKSGTSSSNFTITDRLAELTADYININGSVTYSGLSDDAKKALEKETLEAEEESSLVLTDESGNTITDESGNRILAAGLAQINFTPSSGESSMETYFHGQKVTINSFVAMLDSDSVSDGTGYIVYRLGTGGMIFWYDDEWHAIDSACTGSDDLTDPDNDTDIFIGSYTKESNVIEYSVFDTWKDYRDIKLNVMLGEWASDAISETTEINGGLIKTGTVMADQIASGAITTKKLATDAIKSTNYKAASSGDFSSAGTYLNLANGSIQSKNFAITSDGSAHFSGEITADSGTIANLEIDNGGLTGWSDYSGTNQYLIVAPEFIQMYQGNPNNAHRIYMSPYGSITCYDLTQTSDERLKDIGEWTESYDDFLMSIRPIAFKWKDDIDTTIHMGIGAQSTLASAKECGLPDLAIVKHDEEKDTYGVLYSELNALSIAAIQKNRQMIETMQKQIEELQAKIEELTNKEE